MKKSINQLLSTFGSVMFISVSVEGQTYVQASGASLDNDYDDVNVMRHRGKNVKEPQVNE